MDMWVEPLSNTDTDGVQQNVRIIEVMNMTSLTDDK